MEGGRVEKRMKEGEKRMEWRQGSYETKGGKEGVMTIRNGGKKEMMKGRGEMMR
jgi:hypothetical protein